MHPMLIRGLAKIESQLQQQLLQAYQLFDNRHRDYIDASSLSQGMKVLGYQIQKKQIQQMISTLDIKNTGVISKQQYKKFMTARLDFRDHQQDIKQAFDYFDGRKRQKIVDKDVARIAQEIGQNSQESGRIIYQADKDQDGAINYQQFFRVIKKTSYY